MSEPIVVHSSLRPRDYFRVAVMSVLSNRLSASLLISGPAMWTFGIVARSAVVAGYGARLSWVIVALPAFAALVGSYTAYRPGSAELYEPATWTFTSAGIDIEQPSRSARAAWDEFVSWRIVEGCYLLHTDRRNYVIVSASDLSTSERACLEELLDGKLGRRRH